MAAILTTHRSARANANVQQAKLRPKEHGAYAILAIPLACALAPSNAFAFWAMWLLGFTATTFAVHSVIAAQKRRPRGRYAVTIGSVSLLTVSGVWMQLPYLAAVIPMLIASWFLFLRPPAARYLKQVGWALVSVMLLTSMPLIL